ncbi:hypothetical protein Zmor_019779 [Zophobas morio]|uniref:Gustatory receptor n=1 Tax=Zophobas morio TaxID=2755281 RepID=A0AA38M9D5_9CUCU|nr:hypothetical protein Zmor_019779 [Zophobas morio]
MTFKLSVKDINFIRCFHTYLNIFLVTPWYDFDRNVFVRQNITRTYALLLLMLKTMWLCYLINSETLKHAFKNMLLSEIIFYVVTCINCTIISVVTILKTCFWGRAKWKQLYTNFQHIDVFLRNKGKEETCWWKNVYCILFLKHLLFIVLCVNLIYSWYKVLKRPLIGNAFLVNIFDVYYHFMLLQFANWLLHSFNSRYRDLNKTLVAASRNPKRFPNFKNLARMYRILGENVKIFNDLFGQQMVFLLFQYSVGLVESLNRVYITAKIYKNVTDYNYIIISNFNAVIFLMFNYVNVFSNMDSTVRQAEKFIHYCYKLQDDFQNGSKEGRDLIHLSQSSERFVPKFSAAGYFTIKKSVILSLLGNVATYLIIFIQLNESESTNLKINESIHDNINC